MSCRACLVVRQLVFNTLLIADMALNTFTGGDPHETVSRRTARAALTGNRLAVTGCRVLGWFSKDHCTWALQTGSIGREIWSWSDHDLPKTITAPTRMEGT